MSKTIKRRMVILLVFAVATVSGTFALLTSETGVEVEDQKIATFIFDLKKDDQIEIPIVDIKPGDDLTYNFSVTNKKDTLQSDVTVMYRIIIQTYLFLPLDIGLYQNGQLIDNCDNTSSRNEKNQLVCIMPEAELDYNAEDVNYDLNIKFDSSYNDLAYANLVDFLNLEIQSWQRTE